MGNIGSVKQFGRWRVLETALNMKKNSMWKCRCSCGTTRLVSKANILRGGSLGCGCKRLETLVARNTSHGNAPRKRATKSYSVWTGIIERCNNKNSKKYKNYGGRGISVCQQWLKFENFLADMGHRPDGLSIDRINNDGNYEPGNCRWATKKEQNLNTRQNNRILFSGLNLTVSEWGRRLCVDRRVIARRKKAGKSLSEVLRPFTIRKSKRGAL